MGRSGVVVLLTSTKILALHLQSPVGEFLAVFLALFPALSSSVSPTHPFPFERSLLGPMHFVSCFLYSCVVLLFFDGSQLRDLLLVLAAVL